MLKSEHQQQQQQNSGQSNKADNTHILRKGKYHCTSGLQIGYFVLSSFAFPYEVNIFSEAG